MDRRKGFILVEILLGLLFLGLVAMAALPAMTFARSSLLKATEKSGMIYLCELAAERLKTDDPEILDYLAELDTAGECNYFDEAIDENLYLCSLIKLEHTGEYLSIQITLASTQYEDMEVQLEISRHYEGVLPD